MKRFLILAIVLLASWTAVGQDTMHARYYYAELIKTHSLSGFENEYSCFYDDPEDDHFFIFTTSDALRRFGQVEAASGSANKQQSEAFKALAGLKGDFIVRLDYFNGLPANVGTLFLDKSKDSDSYSAENRTTHFKITLSVNLKTGRYRDDLHRGSTSHGAAYGRCEETSVVEERIARQ